MGNPFARFRGRMKNHAEEEAKRKIEAEALREEDKELATEDVIREVQK